MTPKIERVGDFNHLLGEGPHWDAATKSLYYVDILGKTINKYTPSTKKHTKATLGNKKLLSNINYNSTYEIRT